MHLYKLNVQKFEKFVLKYLKIEKIKKCKLWKLEISLLLIFSTPSAFHHTEHILHYHPLILIQHKMFRKTLVARKSFKQSLSRVINVSNSR